MTSHQGELYGHTANLSHVVIRADGIAGDVLLPLNQALIDTLNELYEGQQAGVLSGHTVVPMRGKRPRLQRQGSQGSVSKLDPKAIQHRLRRGDSVESIAKAAGTDVDHILRWYPPIKAEQDQVIDIVRGAVQERPAMGYSAKPIGEAVLAFLRDTGVDTDLIEWSAVKPDGRERWVVSMRYRTPSGTSSRIARWTCDPDAMTVMPRDEHARDLGWVSPGPGGEGRRPLTQREALGITPNPAGQIICHEPPAERLLQNRTSPRGNQSPKPTPKEKYVPYKNYEPARPPSPRRPIGD